MESTFSTIQETKERIDANIFSIHCAKEQIEQNKKELVIQKDVYEALQEERQSLSRKIEEAEISYMRTDHIHELIIQYSKRIQNKLDNVMNRTGTLPEVVITFFSAQAKRCKIDLTPSSG